MHDKLHKITSRANLTLRPVRKEDQRILYDWANDSLVREQSFDKTPIDLAQHKLWFEKKFCCNHTRMWIMSDGKCLCGFVRVTRSTTIGTLSYLIPKPHRDQKLAQRMLIMAIRLICIEWSALSIATYTIPNNIASNKSLRRVGFTLNHSNQRHNCYVYRC
jgi:RimJ/RimL family protein N-acetyltransferase